MTTDELGQAYRLLLKAAGAGVAPACYWIGHFREFGIGAERNEEKAFNWYRKAAEGGERDAFLPLARCYARRGKIERAKFWAAKDADLDSLLFLGRLFLRSRSVNASRAAKQVVQDAFLRTRRERAGSPLVELVFALAAETRKRTSDAHFSPSSGKVRRRALK